MKPIECLLPMEHKDVIIESQHLEHIIFMLCSDTNICNKLVHIICIHSSPGLLSLHHSPGVHSSFHLVWASRLSIITQGEQEWWKHHPESTICLFHSSKRPFYLNAISASSLMQCPFSNTTDRWQSHLTMTGWTEWAKRLLFVESDSKERRCQYMEEFQGRFFLQKKKR